MSNRIKVTLEPEPEVLQKFRDECAQIAAIEAHYWGELGNDKLMLIAIGAMGAAANICGAILRGITPEQHRAECDARAKAAQPIVAALDAPSEEEMGR